MHYLEFITLLDTLSRYYPRFHSHESLLLADDILKWLHNELPDDSSRLIYLKACFRTPSEAIRYVWAEIQLLAGPLINVN